MKPIENIENTFQFHSNTIVQAGAGTGKTTALINFYLKLLGEIRDRRCTSVPHFINIDEIVAITFTEKAANQMKERIRVAIDEKISDAIKEELADNELAIFWRERKEELFKANINTIHGFCSSILREYSIEANIDRESTILEELEADIILEDLIDSLLKEKVKDKNEEVIKLLYDYGFSGSTYLKGLKDSLLSIYKKMREVDWVEKLKNEKLGTDGLRQSPFSPIFLMKENKYYEKLINTIKDLDTKIKLVKPVFNSREESYIGLLNSWNKFKSKIISSGSAFIGNGLKPFPNSTSLIEELVHIEEFIDLKRLPRKVVSGEGEYDLSKIVKVVKETITSDKVESGLIPLISQILSYPSVLCIYRLIVEIDDMYTEEKRRLNGVDFTDLQIFTRNLLRDNLKVRKELKEKFKVILVDEFQDTNALQQQIIFYLAEDEKNEGIYPDIKLSDRKLFLIGDPKQSIYKFRGADVSIFNRVKAKILGDNAGDFITFNTNYRSKKAIIDFVNALFSEVFALPKNAKVHSIVSKDFEIDYVTDKHQLTAHRSSIDSRLVEIIEMDIQDVVDKTRSIEAEVIAQRILQIVNKQDSEIKVYDKDEKQVSPLFKHITILLHKFTQLDIYEDALRKYNIPYYVVKGRGFYKNQEILDVYNFLSVLINPTDTVTLVGILRSPFFEVSDEGIFLLSRSYDLREFFILNEEPIKEATYLSEFDREKFSEALTLFRKLAILKDRIAISELIEFILDKTDYLSVISATNQGMQKVANIKKLIRIASDFEAKAGFSLREFINYLERLINTEPVEADLQILYEEDNVVKVMTIHQAKGLQFPIVIVPDIGQTAPPATNDRILFDEGLGVALKVYSPEILSHKNTIVYNKIVNIEKAKDIAESKRLFYVAITRAQDYLIISSSKSRNTPNNSWLQYIEQNYEKLSGTVIQKKASDFSVQGEDEKFSQNIPRTPLKRGMESLFEKYKDNFMIGNKIPLPLDQKQQIVGAGFPHPVLEGDETSPLQIEKYVDEDKIIKRIVEPAKSISRELILNVTAINNYTLCERAFYLESILKIKTEKIFDSEEDGTDEANPSTLFYEKSAMELGSIAHKILELFDVKSTEKDIAKKTEELCGLFNLDISSEEAKQLIVNIEKLLQSKEFKNVKKAKKTYREIPFSFLIEDKEHLKFFVNGKIDILLENMNGTYSIMDYKYATFNGSKSINEYLTQLSIYYYALSLYEGITVDSVYLVFLRDKLHFEKLKLDLPKEIKSRLLKIGYEIVEKISRNDEKFWKKCEDKKRCSGCSYNMLCG